MTSNVPGIGGIDFKTLSQAIGVSEAELRKMSNEELTQLISSTKNLSDVDESQLPLDKSESIFTAQETKKDGWLKRTWNKVPKWAKYTGAAILGVGAVVGGVAAVAASGGMAAAALPKLGLAVAGMVGASAIMQSCVKNEYHDQTVICNFSFDDLLAAILAGNAQQGEILAQLIEQNHKLDSIILYLIQHGTQLDQIIDLLKTQGLQLDAIIQNQEELKPILQDIQNTAHNIENLSVEQNAVLTQMLQTLMSIDANTQLTNEQIAELKDLIHEVLAKLDQIDAHNVESFTQLMLKMDEVIAALQQIDEHNQAGFNQLLAQLLVIGGDIQDLLDAVHENGNTLNLILEKMGSINNNIVGMQGFLNNILAELINMHGDMNTNNEQNMQLMLQLIDLVGQNNTLLQGLTQQQQAQFAQLMAQIMAIIGNQNNAQVSLETIISLIEENNQLIANLDNTIHDWSNQQQEQFNQLMAQIMLMIGNQENANATLNAILEAIQNATTQGNMNAQQIIALLNNMNGTIQGWQAQQQQQFYELMAAIMTVVGNQNNANETLNAILNLVQQGNVSVSEILNALNNISDKMDLIQAQLQLMTAENRAFYQAILDKLDGMSLQQQQAFLNIIQRMINMQNSGDANAQAIIQAIQNLDFSGGLTEAQFNQLLQAINYNTQSVNNQGMALAAILTQILAKLDSIDNKVGAIQTVANNIYAVAQSTNGISQQILDILLFIKDNGLPCGEGDDCCEQVIAILQEILDEITSGDWNHEGVIEDEWDDLFGK